MTYIFLPVGLRSLHFRRFSLKGSYQDIVRNFLKLVFIELVDSSRSLKKVQFHNLSNIDPCTFEFYYS